mgnify:CR=1 FL=1
MEFDAPLCSAPPLLTSPPSGGEEHEEVIEPYLFAASNSATNFLFAGLGCAAE